MFLVRGARERFARTTSATRSIIIFAFVFRSFAFLRFLLDVLQPCLHTQTLRNKRIDRTNAATVETGNFDFIFWMEKEMADILLFKLCANTYI